MTFLKDRLKKALDGLLMSRVKSSGQFVVPGQRLGVIEEFVPNSGTYVKDGYIFFFKCRLRTDRLCQ